MELFPNPESHYTVVRWRNVIDPSTSTLIEEFYFLGSNGYETYWTQDANNVQGWFKGQAPPSAIINALAEGYYVIIQEFNEQSQLDPINHQPIAFCYKLHRNMKVSKTPYTYKDQS